MGRSLGDQQITYEPFRDALHILKPLALRIPEDMVKAAEPFIHCLRSEKPRKERQFFRKDILQTRELRIICVHNSYRIHVGDGRHHQLNLY